jgi:hypothetical protein
MFYALLLTAVNEGSGMGSPIAGVVAAAVIVVAIVLIRKRRKNKAAAKSIVSNDSSGDISVTITSSSHYEDVRQKTNGELSRLSLDGYMSPSGGFTNYGLFKVSGVNSNTKRKNTVSFKAKNETEARALALSGGLSEPFEVSIEPMPEPTERQLQYAADISAVIPQGASQSDISAIISRITDEDELPSASEELALFANECGCKFSLYTGHNALIDTVLGGIDDRNRAAFYVYAVWRSICDGGDLGNLNAHPLRDVFYGFADFTLADSSVIKSINDNVCDRYALLNPSKHTSVYKAASSWLSSHGAC